MGLVLKDLPSIQAAFAKQKGKKWALSSSDFNITAIQDLIDTFFDGTLQITPNILTLKKTTTPKKLLVDCDLDQPLLGQNSLKIVFVFTELTGPNDIELALSVKGFPKTSIFLSQAFSQWRSSIFDEFGLVVTNINICSDTTKYAITGKSEFGLDFQSEAAKLTYPIPAMNIESTHSLGSDFSLLIPKAINPLPISGKIGFINIGKNVKAPVASFPFGSNQGFTFFGNSSTKFEIGIATVPFSEQNLNFFPVLGDVSATYTFPSQSVEVSASFSNMALNPLNLELDYQPDIGGLLELADYDKKTKGLFPENLPHTNDTKSNITLKASILRSKKAIDIASISLGYTTDAAWNAFPGILKFSGLEVDLTLNKGEYPNFVISIGSKMQFGSGTADFDGRLTLGGEYMNKKFVATQQSFYFGLTQGKTFNVGDLFDQLGIPVPKLDKLICDDLVIEGDAVLKYFHAECHFKFTATLLGLDITGAGLSVSHFPEFNSVSFTGSAQVKGSTTGIDTLVEYDNGTYIFELDFTGLKINLGDYLKHHSPQEVKDLLNTKLGSYLNFSLTKVFVSFSNSKNYSIELDAIDSGKPVSFILSCTNGVVEVTFSLGDFTFSPTPLPYVTYNIPNSGKGATLFDFKQIVGKQPSLGLKADDVPDIRINIEQALIAYKKTTAKPKDKGIVAYVNLSESFSLSQIPLVGHLLPGGHEAKIELTDLVYATEYIKPADIASISGLPASLTKFKSGFSMSFQLYLGEEKIHLTLEDSPTGTTKFTPTPPTTPATGANTPSLNLGDGVKWKKVNKQFGPLFIKNIGASLAHGDLTIGITGSITLGTITAELIGLTISSPLHTFHPKFGLSGIALDFNKPPLEIAGFLLRTLDKQGFEEFTGGLIINTGASSIAAIGSYAEVKPPSMFIYGFLGLPMNGEPIVSITGLAAGFGLNRTLTLPQPDEIPSFPLLKVAENDGSGSLSMDDLMQLSAQMQTDFKVQDGTDWLALGIRLDVLELIDGFVLIAPVVSKDFVLNVLGVFTLVAPSGVDRPLAEVQLAFAASYDIDEGVLEAKGGLTRNSWVIDKDARIRGDFYFVTFFKDPPQTGTYKGEKKGDFIIVAGGFGPLLKDTPPVPYIRPISLSWKISDDLLLSGGAYFAFVPHAMAAGGNLSINFKAGGKHYGVSASAKFSADFLIEWKPFHYIAVIAMSVALRVKVWLLVCTKHVSLSASANLHVYGPPFSGHGSVRVHVLFTFHVHVSWGSASENPNPKLDWADFKDSFLPSSKSPVPSTITIKKGLLKKVQTQSSKNETIEWWVVNPKTLSITVSSSIPSTTIQVPSASVATYPTSNSVDLGVKPMKIDRGKLTSEMTIDFKELDTGTSAIKDMFVVQEIRQNVPSAVWGDKASGKLVEDALVGLNFTMDKPTCSTPALTVDASKLQFDLYEGETIKNASSFSVVGSETSTSGMKTESSSELCKFLDISSIDDLALDSVEGLDNVLVI